MLKRMIIVGLFGLIGTAILAGLGIWQLQRLAYKESLLADLDARIAAEAVELPSAISPEGDRYLPVTASGQYRQGYIRVLVSLRGRGAGYRIISPFQLDDGRVIMVDRGFSDFASVDVPVPAGRVELIGNLHWPDERDQFTPENDLLRNQWYARNVGPMADYLQTEPVLLILRESSVADELVMPLPVTSEGIPNNHLGYAIQWFGLAIVWLGMTLFLAWRIRRGRS